VCTIDVGEAWDDDLTDNWDDDVCTEIDDLGTVVEDDLGAVEIDVAFDWDAVLTGRDDRESCDIARDPSPGGRERRGNPSASMPAVEREMPYRSAQRTDLSKQLTAWERSMRLYGDQSTAARVRSPQA
jgi:hypothetical protein